MTTPREWKKLTPYQQARLRTEMWLGSRDPHTQIVLEYGADGPTAVEATWVPALFCAFREIFDNALDETAAHGNGNRVDVWFDPTRMVFTVEDNGRGVPIEFDKKEGKHAATILLSEAFAGRNFEEDRGATRGLNGVGAAMVNNTSEYFLVDVNRDRKHFNQRFLEGQDAPTVEDPIILPSKSTKTGTRIEFKPSGQVFRHMILTEDFLRNRVYEAALCYPGLKIYFNGTLIKPKSVEKDLFGDRKPIVFTIEQEGFRSDFWLVPEFFQDGTEYAHSMVNAIPMFAGGVHLKAFERNFFAGMLDALASKSKSKKLTPNRSDLADGMLIFNLTQMDAPAFDGQAKTRLVNENVVKIINAAMQDPEFYKGVMRRNPEWIEAVYERCAIRTQRKDDAELAKLNRAGKRAKVEKLKDATSVDRKRCILFLGEGDSAISGLNEARDAEIHGGLPLRGKVLNVNGKPLKEIYANEALAQIVNSLGLEVGKRANRSALRYGRVYVATDADEDGKNIAALLTNFFFTLWPELFDPANPFLFIFETPLIIAVKGKQRKYWYADSYEEFNPEQYRGWEITRAKGLAALKKADWKYVLENTKLIPIVDDGNLRDALDLIFNEKRANDRKQWIGM
jgi:DNA gyrase/topoisomerase IV subunit B